MALWSVIRILYLYACISLTGKLTKLFLIHLEQSWSLWYKLPAPPLPPTPQQTNRKKKFIRDLSISCNFQQVWFSWQKSSPPHPTPFHPSGKTGKTFLDWIYPFHVISSNFGSAGRKAPHPLRPTCFPTRSTTRNERPLVGYGDHLVDIFSYQYLRNIWSLS